MKTIKNFLLCLAVVSAFSILSCSSDDDGGDGGSAAAGTITAKIDGSSFTSLEITSFASKNSSGPTTTLILQGNTQSQAINLLINGYEGEGTYEITDANVFIVASYIEPNISDPMNTQTWSAPFSGSGVIGEIKISEETDSGVKGTFNFTGKNSQDDSQKVITEGSFNLNFL
jgi:hypothetical protein